MKIERSYKHLVDVVVAQIAFETACLQVSVIPDATPAQRKHEIDRARLRVAAIIKEADDVERQEINEMLNKKENYS